MLISEAGEKLINGWLSLLQIRGGGGGNGVNVVLWLLMDFIFVGYVALVLSGL